ncbi:hypothetical protein [Thiomicrorhabdus aquaedulcis]|nr:hypothetical protein [Thiomicrorhabdus aquaedulcis]
MRIMQVEKHWFPQIVSLSLDIAHCWWLKKKVVRAVLLLTLLVVCLVIG